MEPFGVVAKPGGIEEIAEDSKHVNAVGKGVEDGHGGVLPTVPGQAPRK